MSNEEKKKRADYKQKRKNRITLQTIIISIVTLVLIVCSVLYVRMNETYYIDYTEKSTVDYKVHLKENDFYEEEYLEKGQAYLATLIDTVEAEISYQLDMDAENVNYEYTYSIDAVLSINDRGTGKPIFTKDYVIKEETTAKENSNNTLNINEKFTLNYDEYNNLAQEFLDFYKVSYTSNVLIVTTHISVVSICDDFNDNTSNDTTITLNIPLTIQTVDVSFTTSYPTEESRILACDRGNNKEVFKYIAIGSGIADGILLLILVAYVLLTRNDDIDYANKVAKLVRNYKSYIQKIKNEFDTLGYQILHIDTFNEMLEIRDTLQSPILMHENEDQTCTTFYIPTNTKIVYVHDIKIDNYDKIYGVNEQEKIPYNPNDNSFNSYLAGLLRIMNRKNKVDKIVINNGEINIDYEDDEDEIDDEEVIEKPVTPVVHEEIVNEEVIEPEIIGEPEVEVDESGEYTSRFNYSFEAKLIMSDYEVKEQYRKIITFAKAYGVKVSRSWKRERIYLGRKLFATVIFKGKKLCLAFPLDPKEYAGTKYRFVDMSEVKKYENTPLLMKITSERKVKYVCELLEKLFKEANIENQNLKVDFRKIPYKSKNVLLKNGLIKTNLQNQK